MGNLTKLIANKTIELTELKSTIDGMGWFIEKGDDASLRDVKHQCSLIVDKLNERYFVEYVVDDKVIDIIKFHQDSYNTIGIDLSYDYGYKSRGRVQLFRWNQYGNLELSFTRSHSTPNDVVDIVYDIYINNVLIFGLTLQINVLFAEILLIKIQILNQKLFITTILYLSFIFY